MNIRRAAAGDAAQACAVIRGSIVELCHADHGGDEALLAGWLSNKTVENVGRWIAHSHVLVAEEAGRIVGVAAMTGQGVITLNYVAPDARLRGVSKALLAGLEGQAKTLGIAQCSLESTQTALRFYQAMGYVASKGAPATVLVKRLSGA